MSLPQKCIIAQNRYGLYCVPLRSKERPASKAVIEGRVWEPDTISLICRFAESGDVIHAGTFFGDFLPALSRALIPFAKVWAFEPNSENYQSAAITCRLNELTNVELHSCGLSKDSYNQTLKIGQDGVWMGGGSQILKRAPKPGEETENIALVTIDSVVPPYRRVSVLQLDVEGHELAALAGGLATVLRWRPLIILETVPKDWVEENLLPVGYRAVGQCHGNSVFASSDVKIA